jgi:hypothetical protein
LAVLPENLTPANLRSRNARGETVLAYGAKERGRGRHDDAFDPLDPVAVRVTEKLASKIGVKEAVKLTADTWPLWSDGVALAETYPGGERPAREQIYLVIADLGDEYASRIGGLADLVKDLPAETSVIHGVSIDRLLAELRADAKARGVVLPDRLAPAFGSPEYVRWRESIDDDPRQIEVLGAMNKGGDQECSRRG